MFCGEIVLNIIGLSFLVLGNELNLSVFLFNVCNLGLTLLISNVCVPCMFDPLVQLQSSPSLFVLHLDVSDLLSLDKTLSQEISSISTFQTNPKQHNTRQGTGGKQKQSTNMYFLHTAAHSAGVVYKLYLPLPQPAQRPALRYSSLCPLLGQLCPRAGGAAHIHHSYLIFIGQACVT